MSTFEILCVTMGQKDFSKIKEMNIHSDVVFSNQDGRVAFEEKKIQNHTAKMITTNTKGVGKNRNIALMYATADICLFADDDVIYKDDVEDIIMKEFAENPDADVMIFHLETSDKERPQKQYAKTRKCSHFERMPWATFRVCFKREKVLKANVMFTQLYGGGCIFPSGEDSMWLKDAQAAGLSFYVSNKTIGTVSFEKSTWFTGYDEKFYYSKGAFYANRYPMLFEVWAYYCAFRTKKYTKMSFSEQLKWIRNGRRGYDKFVSFDSFKAQLNELVK